jgi:hypothetical protein
MSSWWFISHCRTKESDVQKTSATADLRRTLQFIVVFPWWILAVILSIFEPLNLVIMKLHQFRIRDVSHTRSYYANKREKDV